MEKELNSRALLITGEMRSGTTFLANFLNSQEQMVVYADMLVSLFMEAHALNIKNIKKDLSEREKNVLFSNLIQEGKLHHLDFSCIDREKKLSWLDLFKQALTVIKGDESAKIVGVKRTREEEYLSQMLKSGTKVIYSVRDPRDVMISAKNRFARFNLFHVAENWQKSVQVALELRSHSSFLILRYEDLILEKEETAARLAQFLELPIKTDIDNLKFGKDKSYRDNSSFGDINKLFDPSATYRWKNRRNHPEIDFVERLLEVEMQELSYETQSNKQNGKAIWQRYKRQKLKEALISPFKKMYHRWIR
jgi:hypothetical protein